MFITLEAFLEDLIKECNRWGCGKTTTAKFSDGSNYNTGYGGPFKKGQESLQSSDFDEARKAWYAHCKTINVDPSVAASFSGRERDEFDFKAQVGDTKIRFNYHIMIPGRKGI